MIAWEDKMQEVEIWKDIRS